MIKRETIEEIFQIARVEEVLGEFLNLKKSGSNFKALSPFTDERTPSLMISPSKQIWKDFSSGKGGNVVTFLMEHEHFTYPEALRFLANKYNIEIQETQQTQEQKQENTNRESLFIVSEFAKKYFRDSLHSTEEGKLIGLSYLKERGYNLSTIETFDLGYCSKSWDSFSKKAIQEGYEIKYLKETGLTIISDNNKFFDRFKHRVVFPIHSFSGRIVGFAGRIIDQTQKGAKYINSPESLIYNKSKTLYGIFQAKKYILKNDNCFLVEGYTDVLTLHQAQIKNVVASSGTSLTIDQVRILKRITNNLTILYDSDSAGIQATLRGANLILTEGLNVKVVTFPNGEDPDSFARKNPFSKVKEILSVKAQDFLAFKTNYLLSGIDQDPIKKADVINEIVKTIALIPDFVKKQLYVRQSAKILQESEELLFSRLAIEEKSIVKTQKTKNEQQKQNLHVVQSKIKEVSPLYVLERALLKIALLYGGEVKENAKEKYKTTMVNSILESLNMDGLEIQTKLYANLFQELKQVVEKGISIESFCSTHPDIEVANLLSNLLVSQYNLSDWEKKGVFIILPDEKKWETVRQTLNLYKRERVRLMMKEIDNEIKNASSLTDNTLNQLLEKRIKLKQIQSAIDKERGRVVF